AERVDHFVRIVEESDVDLRSVGVGGDDIVGEVVVNGCAETRVIHGLFKESHADSHDDRALNLVARRLGIEDVAGIDHRDYAGDAETSDLWLPGHLGKLCPKGMGREITFWIAKRTLGFSASRGGADVARAE